MDEYISEARYSELYSDAPCPYCKDTGHIEECNSRQGAYDLTDLSGQYPCEGCCPNGCKP